MQEKWQSCSVYKEIIVTRISNPKQLENLALKIVHVQNFEDSIKV